MITGPCYHCESCGRLLVKRQTEAPSRFAKRRTCSLSCAAKLQGRHGNGGRSIRDYTPIRTYQQVADALGISKAYVQQIEAKAFRKLRIWAEGWR